MNITNGVVEYERQTRPADYESKKAKVSLSFAIAEGEDFDAVLSMIGGLAMRRAQAMVGEAVTIPSTAPRQQPPKANKAKVEEAKAEPEVDPSKEDSGFLGRNHRRVPATDVGAASETSAPATTQASAEQVEILDKDLDNAVKGALTAGVDGNAIKAEIGKLVAAPGASMRTLGQEERRLLLKAIHELHQKHG